MNCFSFCYIPQAFESCCYKAVSFEFLAEVVMKYNMEVFLTLLNYLITINQDSDTHF